ncbi:MAG: hypothetical protein C3F07_10065 [Anaerolineales bacterium]|nr:MAG: hypothetical protein C3F07_10065 [Anaerolineales bacterium]
MYSYSNMTLEISLRPPFSIPRLFRADGDEPPKYHWAQPERKTQQGFSDQGGQSKKPQEPQKPKEGIRPLSDIDPNDVKRIRLHYEPQLVRSQLDGWIAQNHFVRVHLKSQRGRRPPEIFGRVKYCYPNDDHVHNVQEFQLFLPHKDGPPDTVHIHASDINFHAEVPVESFYLQVRLMLSTDEASEFKGREDLFWENGFAPQIADDYLELLDMDDRDHQSQPWLYVIGSRWLTTVPDERFDAILSKLREMLGWQKQILNYHPDWLPGRVKSLNRLLKLKHKLTPHYLTEPGNPQEAIDLVALLFDEMFLGNRSA